MTDAPVLEGDDDEPVSKRTRRSGVVASIGDPTLKDRTRVAPLFLTKREKQEKQYKKEQEKLAESTKTRLNDWKSVIGVEKDASKVCPVFQRASLSSATPATADSKPPSRTPIAETAYISPLPAGGIIPDPYKNRAEAVDLGPMRMPCSPSYEELDACMILHRTLTLDEALTVNLVTPCKVAPLVSSPSSRSEYDDIDKPLQTACLTALTAMGSGKPETAQMTDWIPLTSRDWCAARLEPRRQHALAKWLSKWKDEDTAVRRNKVAPILLVSGPTGCGKTALVYAAAAELNIQVLEVSPADFSWQANGKRPMSEAVKEALQSRQVKNEGALSQIVLIDDVDVLVKEDRSVLNAIMSMTDDSKRPLVLTCRDEECITRSNIDVNQTFAIEPIDFISASFLVHAYSVVLAEGGKKPLSREEANSVARHTGSDLRRIAMAAELGRFSETLDTGILPDSVFCLDSGLDMFSNKGRLGRVLSGCEDLPIRLRNDSLSRRKIDVLDIAHQALETESDSVSLEQWMRVMSDLSVAACTAVPAGIAAHLAMDSVSVRLSRKEWVTETEIKTCLDLGSLARYQGAGNLIDAFTHARTAFYINSSEKRQGIVMSYLGCMAQLSNSSEFSSRRVRCLLDQFAGAIDEIVELRRLFPKN